MHLKGRVGTLERELKEAKSCRASEHASLEKYRNENMRLKAALSDEVNKVCV